MRASARARISLSTPASRLFSPQSNDQSTAGRLMASWKRVSRYSLATLLSLLLALTPLSPLMQVASLAPVTAAQASTPQEDLKACLDTVKSIGGAASAAIDAAEEIVKATSDPEFLACASEAASLNVVTMAFMAAVTGYWATNQDAFDDPASCKEAAAKALLQGVAMGLDAAIDAIGGPVEGILKGLLGEKGLDYIHQIADMSGASGAIDAEKQKLIDEIVGKLADAMGPAMHYLNCGCAAAGTAAIIKNAGEKVAAAASAAANSLEACWDLLTDPGRLLTALTEDPLAVLGMVGKALCDGVAEVVDVCGAAAAVYEAAVWMCEATGVCAAGELLADAGEWLNCHLNPFADCDPPPPPPGPPPTCNPDDVYKSVSAASGGLQSWCTCGPPNGISKFKTFWNSSVSGQYEDWGFSCGPCASNEGVDFNGYCAKCPTGYQQDPTTGKCTQPYTCASNEHYKADNSGCFSCPAGQTWNADGTGCITDCSGKPWLVLVGASPYSPGKCECPLTADNKSQLEINQACVPAIQCNESAGEARDDATNTCHTLCKPNEYYNSAGADPTFWRCEPCGANQKGAGNTCVADCNDEEVTTGASTCQSCPEGTKKSGNSCEPICSDGMVAKAVHLQQSAAGGGPKRAGASPFALLRHVSSQKGGGYSKNPNVGVGPTGKSATGGGGLYEGQIMCVPCGENERMVTVTSGGPGYSISETACMACPIGTTSKPGSTSCNPITWYDVGGQPNLNGALTPAAAAAAAAAGAALRGGSDKGKDDGTARRGATPVKADEKEKSRPRRSATDDDDDDDRPRRGGKTAKDPGNRKSEDPKAPHIRQPKKQDPVEAKAAPKSRAPSLDDIGSGASAGSRGPAGGSGPSAKGGGSTGPSYSAPGGYTYGAPPTRR